MQMQVADWKNWQAQAAESRERLEEPCRRAYQMLLSRRTGVISGLSSLHQAPDGHPLHLYYAHVNMADGETQHFWHGGSGAGLDQYEAMIAALGEAVERYAAAIYDEASDIVWASYNEVKERAIAPTQFALPSETDLARFAKSVARFDPDAPIGWAHGWSIPDGTPLLVPASLTYGLYHYCSFSEQIAPGISTGLAAGPQPNWALMRGICECIERDAFMISYLNRLPLQEIDLDIIDEPIIMDVMHRIRPWHNCQMRAWNMTTDIRVASVLVLLISPDHLLPALVCAAATHVDPVQALRKAVIEAWQSHTWLGEHATARQFAADFSDVLSREEHLLFASQPVYKRHMAWLLAERPKIALKSLPNLSGGTLEQELGRVLEAVKGVGLPVVACNLTTPDVEQAGFHVCRVLLPGTQPLAFGPLLVKAERLYEVPRRLGYTSERTTEASLNPVPHPFP
jgi:ribosomal protein S12 methylthiotransferase accessory factor